MRICDRVEYIIPPYSAAGKASMTELIWEGKYDENGKRVAPLLPQMPGRA